MSLSPLNRLLNACGDLVLQPRLSESPWPSLIVGSVAAAALMVFLFSMTSRQDLLRQRRNRLLARTLELLLFRHDARVSLTTCGRILWANTAYLGAFLKPTAIAMVPMVLILIQMAAWFEYRPLHVGESALLTVRLASSVPVMKASSELKLTDGLAMDGDPVRIPLTNEICWKIRVNAEAPAWAEIHVEDQHERKVIPLGKRLEKISPQRVSTGLWNEVLYPTEPPLKAGGVVEQIDLTFPARTLQLGDLELHWLVASFLIMMIAGLLIGKFTGVSIA